MKKRIIKIGTIVLSFLLGLIFMSYYYNKGNIDMTGKMAEATLPVVYFEDEGTYVNPLYGYLGTINGSSVRNGIMAVDGDRILHLAVKKYNADIDKLTYEVRTMDQSRLVQEGEVSELKKDGGYLKGEIFIKDLFQEGEEYLLTIQVTLGNGKEAKYFSRLTNGHGEWVRACREFALEFHNATLDPNTEYPITQYLETNTAQSNDSFAQVSIQSKYKTVMWGNMQVTQTREPEISYKDIENDVASFSLRYQVSRETENGQENYTVEDYFRIRYTAQRIYLLDYQRTADRIFESDGTAFEKSQINLGIQSEEVPYLVNTEGNVLNFVTDREVWSYDSAQNKLVRIYSFKDGQDPRGLHGEHEIRLINMDDSGSMDFAVIGYMNRGRHEGQTGTAIMRYQSLTNTVEELLFLESDLSYEILSQQVGDLLYINRQDVLYLSYGNDIYAIDLNTKESVPVVTGISRDCYLVSENGACLAWQTENDRYHGKSITTLNLNTGKQNIYTCTEEEAIRSLAFMENDFLYGIAQESDIVLLEDGSEIFPMGIVRIVDENGEEVRKFDYSQEQKYVTAAAVKKNRIELQCLKKTAEGRYETALSEPITGNIQEKVQKIEKKQISHEIKRLETIFSFQEAFTERKRKMISPKEVLYEDNRTLNLETEGTKTQIYLVYGKGQLQGLTEELGEAVLWADQMMGSVVDENGQYLWRRGNRKTSVTIESISTQEPADTGNGIEACAQILLRMENDYRDLSEDIAAGKTLFEILDAYSEKNVCNLSGCSLSMVLYYVSQGQPAAVITSQGQAELLIGYDSSQVVILDPITGEVRKENLSAAESRYEAFGNVFISFIE